jgi:hypothetical protein
MFVSAYRVFSLHPTDIYTTHYVMLQTGHLVVGNHTIVVTLVEIIANQNFIIDYITYMPSFPNLAATPDLDNSSSEPRNNFSSSSPSSNSSNRVDAIAGGVIGGFTCLAIIGIAVLLFVRCQRPSETETSRFDPYLR